MQRALKPNVIVELRYRTLDLQDRAHGTNAERIECPESRFVRRLGLGMLLRIGLGSLLKILCGQMAVIGIKLAERREQMIGHRSPELALQCARAIGYRIGHPQSLPLTLDVRGDGER